MQHNIYSRGAGQASSRRGHLLLVDHSPKNYRGGRDRTLHSFARPTCNFAPPPHSAGFGGGGGTASISRLWPIIRPVRRGGGTSHVATFGLWCRQGENNLVTVHMYSNLPLAAKEAKQSGPDRTRVFGCVCADGTASVHVP